MAENDISQSLSDTVSRLMESPEVADILSSLRGDAQQSAEGGADAKPSVSIPPDIMAKLPSMISALSEMGFGGGAAPASAAQRKTEDAPKKTNDKQRKALLTSLRPYLSPHRRQIIDNMLKIEGLTGLLSSLSIASDSIASDDGKDQRG